jgi:hypothetical protein
MTRPPRTTWFQPCPKLSCSAVGSGRCAFGVAEGLGALPTLLRTVGARLTSAALASFHFAQPRYLVVWFPPQQQHLSCCFGVDHSPER